MKMSDKDFDQLFNSKLADMEMEPSANVWNNIADELDGTTKSKQRTLPFMRIAATIIVLMGVGLFFIRPDKQKIALHYVAAVGKADDQSPAENATASTEDTATNPGKTVITEEATPVKHEQRHETVKIEQMAKTQTIDSTNYIAATQTQNIQQVNTHVTTDAAQPDIKPTNVTAPILPEHNNTPARPNVLAMANTTSGAAKTTEPAKKKRIHSLGDLLNVVIAKVDKREDKLIEFTNTSDDDGFNVTGLNLGVFKAKKEN